MRNPRTTTLLTALLAPLLLAAQEAGLDERIDQAFGRATGWFVDFIFYQFDIAGVPVFWVLFPLILGATFFTIYFRVPGVRLFRVAVNTVRGKYEKVGELPADLNIVEGDQPDTIRVEGSEGEVNHFQALTA
ncbi:MAG: D-alanine glycine permease, partial [Flavobacteriales bacterium]|nr:D-alanine glycine permease [Flavobacteriales bacterium]